MINKIQKASMMTFKTPLIVNQSPIQSLSNREDQIKSIHSYFVMLKHIFLKNKQVMRKRKELSLQNKPERGPSTLKIQRTQETSLKVIQQSFGILKNQKVDNCNILVKGESRNYRPYKSKNRLRNITAKGLSASVPNIQCEKDDAFKPIGAKYQECKVDSSERKHSQSKSRSKIMTCINFYPRYQKKEISNKSEATDFKKSQLKKERKALLISKNEVALKKVQSDSLRSSHKSAYSHKSHISMATEAGDIPSPW